MKGIKNQTGEANVDGLLRLKVIDTFDVGAFHDPATFRDVAILMGDGPLPAGTLFLKRDASFKELEFPAYQGSFNEKLGEGEVWTSTITVTIPKDSPNVHYETSRYRARRLMAILLDANGYARLVGSPEFPLYVSVDVNTAQAVLTFSGTAPTRSYFLPGYSDQELLGQSDFNSDFSFDFAL